MYHNTRRAQNEIVYPPPPSSPNHIVNVSQLNSDFNGLTVSSLNSAARHKEGGQSGPANNPIKLRNKKRDGSDSEFEV